MNSAVESYIDSLIPQRDAILKRLEAEAAREGWPIVGPQEGGLLELLVALARPSRILELGTAIGYSAMWLARGHERTRVTTVEVDRRTADRAKRNLAEAGLTGRVDVVVGDALEVVKGLQGQFEFIFNDIDKEGYPLVLPDLKRLLPKGGLLVTDNVLWSGRVAGVAKDKTTLAIREYNDLLARDPDMKTSLVPIRDGVSIALKWR